MLYDDRVITLGTSKDEVDAMRDFAEGCGIGVKGTSVWDGPIPEGSYCFPFEGMPWIRMSTPEFFMLRKANELSFEQACVLFCEMWSVIGTNITMHNLPKGEVEVFDEPRTTFYRFADYIKPVLGTPEGIRAYEVMVEALHHMDEYYDLMEERIKERCC